MHTFLFPEIGKRGLQCSLLSLAPPPPLYVWKSYWCWGERQLQKSLHRLRAKKDEIKILLWEAYYRLDMKNVNQADTLLRIAVVGISQDRPFRCTSHLVHSQQLPSQQAGFSNPPFWNSWVLGTQEITGVTGAGRLRMTLPRWSTTNSLVLISNASS